MDDQEKRDTLVGAVYVAIAMAFCAIFITWAMGNMP